MLGWVSTKYTRVLLFSSKQGSSFLLEKQASTANGLAFVGPPSLGCFFLLGVPFG